MTIWRFVWLLCKRLSGREELYDSLDDSIDQVEFAMELEKIGIMLSAPELDQIKTVRDALAAIDRYKTDHPGDGLSSP